MNTNELKDIWNESHADTSPDTDKVMLLISHEETKEKRRNIRKALFGVNLTLATGLGAWGLASGKAVLADAWPALVCLLTLWATFVSFIIYRRRATRELGLPQQDLRSVVETMARRTQASWREIRILLAVNVLTVIPLTIASVQRLIDTGKMSPKEAISFGGFAFIVFGLNIVVLATYGLRKLRPRCRLLQERLEVLNMEIPSP